MAAGGPFGRRGVARRRSCPAHMNGVGKASRRRCLNRALKLFAGTATKRGRNWLAGCGCGNVANGHRAATALRRRPEVGPPPAATTDTATRDGGPRAQSFVGTTARLVARPPPDEKPGSRKDGSHSQRDTKSGGWCARHGSNVQPPNSKSGALSVELRALPPPRIEAADGPTIHRLPAPLKPKQRRSQPFRKSRFTSFKRLID